MVIQAKSLLLSCIFCKLHEYGDVHVMSCVVPNTATYMYEFSHSLSHIRTNTATGFE